MRGFKKLGKMLDEMLRATLNLQIHKGIMVRETVDLGNTRENREERTGFKLRKVRRNILGDKIFNKEYWENATKFGRIASCGQYHRYWKSDGEKSDEFDAFSGRILGLKQRQEKDINYFYWLLDREICKGITICVVPSHVKNVRNDSGIAELARMLAWNGRIDKVDYLLRVKSIDKLAYGWNRDVHMQLESIGVNPNMTIEGDVVLLVNDVLHREPRWRLAGEFC